MRIKMKMSKLEFLDAAEDVIYETISKYNDDEDSDMRFRIGNEDRTELSELIARRMYHFIQRKVMQNK